VVGARVGMEMEMEMWALDGCWESCCGEGERSMAVLIAAQWRFGNGR
jgi:hypothetical protein